MFINELGPLWVPKFIALGIYFLFGTKLSWKEGIDICFNVECVLLGRNFDFFGGYSVVTARYLMVTTGYYSLLVVTAGYRSSLLVPTFSMNAFLMNFSLTWKNGTHFSLAVIMHFSWDIGSRSKMFCAKGVFKNFYKIHRKTTLIEYFLVKLGALVDVKNNCFKIHLGEYFGSASDKSRRIH